MTPEQQAFVIEHGRGAHVEDLARVLNVSPAEIQRVRQGGACKRLPQRLDFGELFTRWHGRPPADDEWPAPRLSGSRKRRAYEWQQPELALLASLVGTMSVREIAGVLTTRLRAKTGDDHAQRPPSQVQIRINTDLGLQSGTDLVGGLTTKEAAKIVGRLALVNQAIANGTLKTFRVGKRHVIPRDEFDRWFSARPQPPEGWIRLASLAAPLGILSDSKLPEYAGLGYIPDVIRVHGIGTARGTWYIDPARAKQILDDAVAGRPLQWHGKPLPGNMRAMWAKWQARKHRRCDRCAEIWQGREPETFEEFCERYPTLTLGDKRHLTVRKSVRRRGSAGWRPHRSVKTAMEAAGVTVEDAAATVNRRTRWVRMWLRAGLLDCGGIVRDVLGGEKVRITPLGIEILRAAAADEDVTARDRRVWIGVHAAAQLAAVSITTMHRWRADGEVDTRDGNRGIEFSVESVQQRARTYWAWAVTRYKRAEPPAWLREKEPAA